MYADVQRGRRRGAEFEQKYYMVNEHTIRACKVIFLGDSEVYKAHWVTVIAFNTVRNSCLLAFGKIDKREFISRCEKDIVVTACSIGGGAAGAAALFTPAAAVVCCTHPYNLKSNY